MTTTAWDHLPNAVHIDRVIASITADPDHWVAAWQAVRDAGRDTARIEAQNMGIGAEYDAAWWAVWRATRDGVWEAARDALLALCAFDDCAYMLDSEPSDISMLAMLGDHMAILLLPACNAFHSLKEIV